MSAKQTKGRPFPEEKRDRVSGGRVISWRQNLATINNRRGDHWSSFFFIRRFLAFADEEGGLFFYF